jgi:ribose/xylose/arabinose/galactoside ABC-type transport system permease subunit
VTYSAVVGTFIGDITKDIIVNLSFASDGGDVVQGWLIILVIMLEILLSRTARVLRHVEGEK